jgi:hypothetical protein
MIAAAAAAAACLVMLSFWAYHSESDCAGGTARSLVVRGARDMAGGVLQHFLLRSVAFTVMGGAVSVLCRSWNH